jgi:hypothetical protein
MVADKFSEETYFFFKLHLLIRTALKKSWANQSPAIQKRVKLHGANDLAVSVNILGINSTKEFCMSYMYVTLFIRNAANFRKFRFSFNCPV